jgi:large subunit ribosomal protein L15
MTMLSLANLKTYRNSKTKKKRLGRGNASGKGNYSGKGGKGQRARSGGKNKLTLKGMRGYLLRIPKSRGFKSFKPRLATVNIGVLAKSYKANDEVTPVSLFRKGLIKSIKNGVKILGEGKLDKKLTVRAQVFSQGAKQAIIKAGGRAEILVAKRK